jgi:hypothetical protein
MPDDERPAGPDVQQCPSCGTTAVLRVSAGDGKVSFACRRCGLRWSISERRSPGRPRYTGLERRGNGAFGGFGQDQEER